MTTPTSIFSELSIKITEFKSLYERTQALTATSKSLAVRADAHFERIQFAIVSDLESYLAGFIQDTLGDQAPIAPLERMHVYFTNTEGFLKGLVLTEQGTLTNTRLGICIKASGTYDTEVLYVQQPEALSATPLKIVVQADLHRIVQQVQAWVSYQQSQEKASHA